VKRIMTSSPTIVTRRWAREAAITGAAVEEEANVAMSTNSRMPSPAGNGSARKPMVQASAKAGTAAAGDTSPSIEEASSANAAPLIRWVQIPHP
jgi:hypothetical protein